MAAESRRVGASLMSSTSAMVIVLGVVHLGGAETRKNTDTKQDNSERVSPPSTGERRNTAGLARVRFEGKGGGLAVAVGEEEYEGQDSESYIVDDGGAGHGVECVLDINRDTP